MSAVQCEWCGHHRLFFTVTMVCSFGTITSIDVNGVQTRAVPNGKEEWTRVFMCCRKCRETTVVEYAKERPANIPQPSAGSDVEHRVYKGMK